MQHRNVTYDVMRGIAILSVLVIHTATRFTANHNEAVLGELLVILSRPAVPIFLFLSGMFFKPVALQKRLLRVMLPYILFSVAASLYIYKTHIFQYVGDIPRHLLLGDAFGIYYFVVVIVFLYLLAWLIDSIVPLAKSAKWVFLVSLVLAVWQQPITEYFLHGYPAATARFIAFRSPLAWSVFFFCGICWRAYKDRIRINENLIFNVWLATTLATIILFLLGLIGTNSHQSPLGVSYALATIFMLLTVIKPNQHLAFIGKVSYSIFLSHMFFVYVFSNSIAPLLSIHSYAIAMLCGLFALIGSISIYTSAKYFLGTRSWLIVGA